MKYVKLGEGFDEIEATSERLEMTDLLVKLIKDPPRDEISKVVYLLQGKLYPDYLGVELGIAEKLLIKAVAEIAGKSESLVDGDFKKSGDLGLTVEKLLQRKSQPTLLPGPPPGRRSQAAVWYIPPAALTSFSTVRP